MNKKTQGTEPFNAPVQAVETVPEPYAPQPKTIERQGGSSSPTSHRMPDIRGGICEWCGVIDGNVPSQFQYQLCDHYRGLGEMRCSYCEDGKDSTEVIKHSVLKVQEHPNNPSKLVVWCNSYQCSGKHLARFQVNI